MGIRLRMWLYMILGVLVIVGLLGGIVAGGVFTLVLIPLAVIVFVGALVYMATGRAAEGRNRGEGSGSHSQPPLPHSAPSEPGHVPSSPGALADARRAQQ